MAKDINGLPDEARRLWRLWNATGLEWLDFSKHTNMAEAAPPYLKHTYIDDALKDLAKIEDAIKRYRENRPQVYEEEPKP